MISQYKHSLEMDVLLSHSTWTESSYIRLCVSMLLDDEAFNGEESQLTVASSSTISVSRSISNGNGNGNGTTSSVPKLKENFIELSKIVKVHFEANAKKFSI